MAPPDLTALLGVRGVEVEGRRVRLQVTTSELGKVLDVLGRPGIESLISRPPTLEELFLRHYEVA